MESLEGKHDHDRRRDRGRFGTVLDPKYYNKIGGASFALWGLIHVIVGGIGPAIFFWDNQRA